MVKVQKLQCQLSTGVPNRKTTCACRIIFSHPEKLIFSAPRRPLYYQHKFIMPPNKPSKKLLPNICGLCPVTPSAPAQANISKMYRNTLFKIRMSWFYAGTTKHVVIKCLALDASILPPDSKAEIVASALVAQLTLCSLPMSTRVRRSKKPRFSPESIKTPDSNLNPNEDSPRWSF